MPDNYIAITAHIAMDDHCAEVRISNVLTSIQRKSMRIPKRSELHHCSQCPGIGVLKNGLCGSCRRRISGREQKQRRKERDRSNHSEEERT